MNLSQTEVEEKLNASIEQLYDQDGFLIENDVSERAIAHKLAEYLQNEFVDYNVDCEYNRNIELGHNHPKSIQVLKEKYRAEMRKIDRENGIEYSEHTTEVTAYPDIIVHKRGTNRSNLLIIEIKKSNSSGSEDYDHEKLCAFTTPNGPDRYSYSHGVFIKIPIGRNKKRPFLTWFRSGCMAS